jgi:hypothetical protein
MDRQMTEDLVLRVAPGVNEALVSEYQAQEQLFFAQPALVQRKLEIQASLISRALIDDQSPILFNLPEQVACIEEIQNGYLPGARDRREQKLGGFMDSVTVADQPASQRAAGVEQSSGRGVRQAVSPRGGQSHGAPTDPAPAKRQWSSARPSLCPGILYATVGGIRRSGQPAGAFTG